MAKNSEETTVCQGCMKLISNSKIYIVSKKDHNLFACDTCRKTEFGDFKSVLFELKNKQNQTIESFVKNGLTKDNKKIKIGDIYKKITINSIKKVRITKEFNELSQKVEEDVTFFITEDKQKWIEI